MSMRTIGRVAAKAGVGVETIRFYERKGLIAQPPRPARGHREYAGDTVGNPLAAPASFFVGALTGDTNADRQIDAADLQTIFSSSGSGNGFAGGDITGDGSIDAGDIAHVLANWGQTLAPLPSADAASQPSAAAADALFDQNALTPSVSVLDAAVEYLDEAVVIEQVAVRTAATARRVSHRRAQDVAPAGQSDSLVDRSRVARRRLRDRAVDAAVEAITPADRRRR